MNLDDQQAFAACDPQDVYTQIDSLPEQLLAGWKLGAGLPLPAWNGLRQILAVGMGTSALAAELVAAYTADRCRIPIIIQRDYNLPAWAQDRATLVLALSYSGNTEETNSAFAEAVRRGCCCLAITSGGKMAGFAARHNLPHWEHPARSVTGSALGAFFGMSLALITRLGLIPDPERDLVETVEELSHQQASLRRDVPAVHNPAKRMAGQLVGRWVTIIGAGMLVPVARSWKIQINEMAKAGAQFAEIPEADHNLLAAVEQPEASFHQTLTVFLRSAHDLPPNRLRSDLTRKYFMLQGLPTDFVDAQGSTALANLWTCLHFGDFAAYYLAMAYGVDPNARSVITGFKEELAG